MPHVPSAFDVELRRAERMTYRDGQSRYVFRNPAGFIDVSPIPRPDSVMVEWRREIGRVVFRYIDWRREIGRSVFRRSDVDILAAAAASIEAVQADPAQLQAVQAVCESVGVQW